MNKDQVNMLAADYRNGSELALESIFRQVNPLIENASDLIGRYVDDATKFDCRVVMKIRRALDDVTIKDFAGYVKTIIGNEKSDFLNRRKRKREDVSMTSLESESDEELGFQFADPLARVEEDVLFKEKVALLAQGDDRKAAILLQWSRGASDIAISELLAQRFGGKAESHRKFVTRFKRECRENLSHDC